MNELIVEVPEKVIPILTRKAKYKVLRGGRGSAKSYSIARAFILEAAFSRHRYLCTREMMASIKDSVHRLLVDTIFTLGLQSRFTVKKDSILSVTGSEFIFKGLRYNISEIKSTEGVSRVWVEEAEKVSEDSWSILIPTIRVEGSEIWVSFNPEDEHSATYRRFVTSSPPDCISVEMTFEDNPWFPEVLRKEMEYDKRVDPEKYEHVWLGKTKRYSHKLIFGGKVRVEAFPDAPEDFTRFFYGCDWGFSNDPTVLLRMFTKEWTDDAGEHKSLYIDHEFYAVGVELELLPKCFDTVPGSRKWTIRADNARPETIDFMRSKGFKIEPCEKGKGSVADGIELLRAFEEIVIHPRCPGTIDNFTNYKWRQDRITGEILPIPAEGSDHAPDSARYALEKYRKGKRVLAATSDHNVFPWEDDEPRRRNILEPPAFGDIR